MQGLKNRLKTHLRGLAPEGIVLAYSGGVDSSVLLAVLVEMRREDAGLRFRAVIFDSPLQAGSRIQEAFEKARADGVDIQLETMDPLDIPGFAGNPPDRCYMCKREMLAKLASDAVRNGFRTVIDGTNADDVKTYRPGLKALSESGVRSPLKELGMTKSDVRSIAREMGLAVAVRPASPCLATRFPYGARLTADAIGRVAAGEEELRRILPDNTPCRMRVDGDTVRIEVPPENFSDIAEHREQLLARLKALGYVYITMDMEGFRSGSMDAFLKSEASI